MRMLDKFRSLNTVSKALVIGCAVMGALAVALIIAALVIG